MSGVCARGQVGDRERDGGGGVDFGLEPRGVGLLGFYSTTWTPWPPSAREVEGIAESVARYARENLASRRARSQFSRSRRSERAAIMRHGRSIISSGGCP